VESVKSGIGSSPFEKRRREYARDPNPSFATYGPKTRAAFRRLLMKGGGRPG
jgi:hypothetical protein